MSQTAVLILGGCLLGAIQLVAGVALGMWLNGNRRNETAAERQEMIQARLIAKRLQKLTDDMSTSLGEHRSRLDQASKLLTTEHSATDGMLAELVIDVIGDVVRANQSLQSKLETAESRLEEQAVELEAHLSRSLTDPLTGLPNRREFNMRLEERMSAWDRRGEVFSLLLLDVDHFKKLNDQYGHLAGDQVLAAIGRTLRGAIRREDAVARFGGEEFAILLPGTALAQAAAAAEKVREAIARMVVEHNGHMIAVTSSGGLAAIQLEDQAEKLIQRADGALYVAKEQGRNRTYLHDGVDCRPALSSAAEIVNLINGVEPVQSLGESEDGEVVEFSTYLPQETISEELARVCDDLRRSVQRQTRADGKQ